jgi:methyl-accepting chemotaxis protein
VVQPLHYGRAVLGLLEVAHHRPSTYGPNEVRLIERFGRQVALAVQLDSLFRPMTDSASEMQLQLRELGGRLGELRSNGQRVAEHAGGMRERIDDQGHRTAVGAAETEQLTQDADGMARDARSAAETAAETGRLAATNRGAIAEAIGRLVELRDFVDTEARQLAGLTEASTRISSLVSTIRDLADQTNLLALNAAIEAHRAGEHGLGFAVVADEVRKLADSSGQAAEAAREMVEGVRAQVDAALGRMQAGATRVAGVGDLSQTALGSVDRIVSAASNSAQLTTRIADRADEQRARLSSLLEQIRAVADLAEQNRDGTRDVAVAVQVQAETLADMERAAQALGEVSAKLTEYIERFTEASI